MAKSNEPFWWALFGAGGMVAALFLPITVVVTSLLVATGLITSDQLWRLLNKPLVRVYLFFIISLPLFHWAHRFRFTLADLGLKSITGALAIACYGSAILGSVVAATLLLRLWP